MENSTFRIHIDVERIKKRPVNRMNAVKKIIDISLTKIKNFTSKINPIVSIHVGFADQIRH